jgi:hypothetical protein
MLCSLPPFFKILGAVDPKDFHPISLLGGIYKIIARILANRLKMVWRRLFLGHKMRSSKVANPRSCSYCQ